MSGIGVRRFGVVAGLLIACGGAQPPPPGPPPLCAVQTPHHDAGVATADAAADAGVPHRAARWGSPDQWFALLLQSYDSVNRRVEGPAHDCTGTTVEWHEAQGSCAEPVDNGAPQPDRPLTDDDLILSRVDAHHKLAWAAVTHFDNGEAIGPVALAEITPERVAIRAIGVLRAMPRRARLHLETVQGGTKILVAEGDNCTHPEDPTTCRRSVRLMIQRGDHFEPLTITREDGTCLSPARIDLARDAMTVLTNGWQRKFELAATLTYGDNGVTEHESVVVRDSDPRLPAVPPRVFRRVDSDRILRLDGEHLTTDDLSLWTRIRDEHGTTTVELTDGGIQQPH